MTMGAPDWVSYHAQRDPRSLALQALETGDRMSWGHLEARVAAVAGMLVSRWGVGRGDRVGLIAENDFRVFEVQFACMRIGAIFVPLNWRLTTTELSVLVADAEPSLLFHDRVWAETAVELARGADQSIVLVGWEGSASSYEFEIARATPFRDAQSAGYDDVTHILYTSGTTGIPKGALVTHRTLLSQIQNVFGDCALGLPEAKYLDPMPLFHAGGLTTLCAPMLGAGGSVAFAPRFDPERCLHWLSHPSEQVSHFNGSPIFFEQIAAVPGFSNSNLSGLRHAHVAGATILEGLIEQWSSVGVLVQQFYGGTEMGPSAMAMPVRRVLDKPGSCGRPLMLTRARLIDGDLADVAPGHEGEIVLAGPAITPGYWRRERSSSDFAGEWFRTGDVARTDGEGFFYVVDRVKDVYKSGGESVFPAEIERALLELHSVSEVAVIGVPHTRWGEVGCAIVVPRHGCNPTLNDLHQHLDGRFARYKLPKSMVLATHLPRNALGKTDKKLLRQGHASRQVQDPAGV